METEKGVLALFSLQARRLAKRIQEVTLSEDHEYRERQGHIDPPSRDYRRNGQILRSGIKKITITCK